MQKISVAYRYIQVFLKVKALKKSKAWSIILQLGFSCEMCLNPLSCASPVLRDRKGLETIGL